MSENQGSPCGTFMVFLAGVAVGAVLVALTTPKSGPELRADLKGLGERMKARFGTPEGASDAYGEGA